MPEEFVFYCTAAVMGSHVTVFLLLRILRLKYMAEGFVLAQAAACGCGHIPLVYLLTKNPEG